MVRVFVVAAVRLYREGLADALSREGILVVGVHDGGADVVAQTSSARPDVVLMDMAGANTVNSARDIHHAVPSAAVVALGVGVSESELLAYAEAGITGYV